MKATVELTKEMLDEAASTEIKRLQAKVNQQISKISRLERELRDLKLEKQNLESARDHVEALAAIYGFGE